MNNLLNQKKQFKIATLLIIAPLMIGLALLMLNIDIKQDTGMLAAVVVFVIGLTGLFISTRLLWSGLRAAYKVVCVIYMFWFTYLTLGSIAGYLLSGFTWGGV